MAVNPVGNVNANGNCNNNTGNGGAAGGNSATEMNPRGNKSI